MKTQGNPVPSLDDILNECKNILQFHIDSTYSDTDDVESNLVKKIENYQNGVETDNEQPKNPDGSIMQPREECPSWDNTKQCFKEKTGNKCTCY